jgi:hypothetical protein
MSFKNKILGLIAEGRTIEALRLVQSTVKLTDYAMYTQALLLESQFIDQRRTMALGGDYSHIHHSLVILADEVERRRLAERSEGMPVNAPASSTTWVYVGVAALLALGFLAWQFSKVSSSNV